MKLQPGQRLRCIDRTGYALNLGDIVEVIDKPHWIEKSREQGWVVATVVKSTMKGQKGTNVGIPPFPNNQFELIDGGTENSVSSYSITFKKGKKSLVKKKGVR